MRSLLKIPTLLLTGLAGLATGFTALAKAEPATPPEDVPCTISESEKPTFPLRMLNEGMTQGMVNVLLFVDATGTLRDSLVTAYSRKAFADEALRGLKDWKFTPGRVKGQPVDTVIDLSFHFEVHGVLVLQNFGKGVSTADRWLDKFEYRAAGVQDLDRVPTPLNIVEPTYPREWMKQGIVGEVVVNFYIDETGRTRFPVADPGAHEQLTGIALAAVQQWQFIPPKSKGQPVLVRARQVFQFSADNKP